MVFEWVRGADFSCVLMCGAGPGDLGGPGGRFGRKSKENRTENFQPSCLQVPSEVSRPHLIRTPGRMSEKPGSIITSRSGGAVRWAAGVKGGGAWTPLPGCPLKGPPGSFKEPRGPFKGPHRSTKGPRGPLKGSRDPFKGPGVL